MSNSIVKKDPNGLMARDIAHLRKVFKRKPFNPNTSDREIMYLSGQQSVLDYIEREFMGRG